LTFNPPAWAYLFPRSNSPPPLNPYRRDVPARANGEQILSIFFLFPSTRPTTYPGRDPYLLSLYLLFNAFVLFHFLFPQLSALQFFLRLVHPTLKPFKTMFAPSRSDSFSFLQRLNPGILQANGTPSANLPRSSATRSPRFRSSVVSSLNYFRSYLPFAWVLFLGRFAVAPCLLLCRSPIVRVSPQLPLRAVLNDCDDTPEKVLECLCNVGPRLRTLRIFCEYLSQLGESEISLLSFHPL